MSIHPLLASIGFTQGKWGGAHCPETGATLYQDTVRALMAIPGLCGPVREDCRRTQLSERKTKVIV